MASIKEITEGEGGEEGMNNLKAIVSYTMGWFFFILLYYFGSAQNSWVILRETYFGIGDYILVALYFTSVTAVSLSYIRDRKDK